MNRLNNNKSATSKVDYNEMKSDILEFLDQFESKPSNNIYPQIREKRFNKNNNITICNNDNNNNINTANNDIHKPIYNKSSKSSVSYSNNGKLIVNKVLSLIDYMKEFKNLDNYIVAYTTTSLVEKEALKLLKRRCKSSAFYSINKSKLNNFNSSNIYDKYKETIEFIESFIIIPIKKLIYLKGLEISHLNINLNSTTIVNSITYILISHEYDDNNKNNKANWKIKNQNFPNMEIREEFKMNSQLKAKSKFSSIIDNIERCCLMINDDTNNSNDITNINKTDGNGSIKKEEFQRINFLSLNKFNSFILENEIEVVQNVNKDKLEFELKQVETGNILVRIVRKKENDEFIFSSSKKNKEDLDDHDENNIGVVYLTDDDHNEESLVFNINNTDSFDRNAQTTLDINSACKINSVVNSVDSINLVNKGKQLNNIRNNSKCYIITDDENEDEDRNINNFSIFPNSNKIENKDFKDEANSVEENNNINSNTNNSNTNANKSIDNININSYSSSNLSLHDIKDIKDIENINSNSNNNLNLNERNMLNNNNLNNINISNSNIANTTTNKRLSKPKSIKSSSTISEKFFNRFAIPQIKKGRLIKPQSNEIKKLTEIHSCAICLDIIKDYAYINCCNHLFCRSCISLWIKNENKCPLCKRTISFMKYYKDGDIHNLTTQYISQKSQVSIYYDEEEEDMYDENFEDDNNNDYLSDEY